MYLCMYVCMHVCMYVFMYSMYVLNIMSIHLLISRCMALSTVIFVGASKDWLPDIVEKARKLKVGSGLDPDTDIGESNRPSYIQTYIQIYIHTYIQTTNIK